MKQHNVNFLTVVLYPEWLANVVPVPKKDGRVRMCINYRDLNKVSPKDDFLLPHIDVLVDNTVGQKMLSVVTLKIDVSMHDAKARVLRLKLGCY